MRRTESMDARAQRRSEETRNAVQIAEAAWEEKEARHPGRSIDDLLCEPKEAIKIANAVRKRFPQASDYQVCKALINARKRGHFSGKGN